MRRKTLEQNTAQEFAGLQVDLLQKLRNGNATIEQLKWFVNLSFDQREALMGKEPESVAILECISEGQEILIEACDGTQTFTTAKKTFKSGIDGNFNWGFTQKPGSSTQKTSVQVHEIVKDATLAEMFGSFEINLDKLCLTQHQIKLFCEVHKVWLRKDGYATFFLFKVDEQFFFASVHADSEGLYLAISQFDHSHAFSAKRSPRVVVPQLTA